MVCSSGFQKRARFQFTETWPF